MPRQVPLDDSPWHSTDEKVTLYTMVDVIDPEIIIRMGKREVNLNRKRLPEFHSGPDIVGTMIIKVTTSMGLRNAENR